ncbi:MAG: sigma-E factor negative regulatory protein [Marinomonas sp.]
MTTSDGGKYLVSERLSAMFDDEANTQDIDILLQQDVAELDSQMEAFNLIQATLHKESDTDVFTGLNLAALVSAQIANEESQEVTNNVVPLLKTTKKAVPVTRSLWTGFAVAASVAFIVVLGGNLILDADSVTTPELASTTSPAKTHEVSSVASLSELKQSPMDVDSLRLQNYLRQHAEQSAMTVGQGMIPMARVVSYPIKE